jgi:hypothetical protein
MAEVLLISENYIKKYTTVNGSVDPNLLYPSVYLAQDKWLQAWLGTNLLNELKQQVADENILPDYEVLLNDYVQKCLLWWKANLDPPPFPILTVRSGALRTMSPTRLAQVSPPPPS